MATNYSGVLKECSDVSIGELISLQLHQDWKSNSKTRSRQLNFVFIAVNSREKKKIKKSTIGIKSKSS